ncbi:hypothetical protein ACSBR2_010692 [Camellia fascicularis]
MKLEHGYVATMANYTMGQVLKLSYVLFIKALQWFYKEDGTKLSLRPTLCKL